MEQILCPHCKETFKADTSKKYQDCPNCKYEFANSDLTKAQLEKKESASLSLSEKIKRAQKNY